MTHKKTIQNVVEHSIERVHGKALKRAFVEDIIDGILETYENYMHCKVHNRPFKLKLKGEKEVHE